MNWLPLAHAPTRDQALPELNWWPFTLLQDAQPTEPDWPGLYCFFRERGRERERERWMWERNIDWFPPVHTLIRNWTHNLSVYGKMFQPSEPHWPGYFLKICNNPAHAPKLCRLDPWSEGIQETTNWCFSLSLSLTFSLSKIRNISLGEDFFNAIKLP